MRSTSLISPVGGQAAGPLISNDETIIVHNGRKISQHQNQQSLNKVSSAYRQDLTQLMKQSQTKLSKDGSNLYDVDAFAQLRRIFGKK